MITWADFTETERQIWTLEFIELAEQEVEGYDWVKEELGIEEEVEDDNKTHVLLGSCARAPRKE